MYDRLLDDVHTDGHGVGGNVDGGWVAKGDSNGYMLVAHWHGEGVSDDRLHGERGGRSGGKRVWVRVGREVLWGRRWKGEEGNAVLDPPRIGVETLRGLP